MLKGRYRTRSGASGICTIETIVDARMLLKGGRNITTARIEDADGNVVGQRWRDDLDGKYRWTLDPDAFRK